MGSGKSLKVLSEGNKISYYDGEHSGCVGTSI